MSGQEVKNHIDANTCSHCGEWVVKMAELTRELIEKDAKIKRLSARGIEDMQDQIEQLKDDLREMNDKYLETL